MLKDPYVWSHHLSLFSIIQIVRVTDGSTDPTTEPPVEALV